MWGSHLLCQIKDISNVARGMLKGVFLELSVFLSRYGPRFGWRPFELIKIIFEVPGFHLKRGPAVKTTYVRIGWRSPGDAAQRQPDPSAARGRGRVGVPQPAQRLLRDLEGAHQGRICGRHQIG